MKVILTGATGFVGGEVFEQCVAHPDITAILVLSRRALTSPSASNSKVSTVILQDFMKYPDSVLKEMKDADICIWSGYLPTPRGFDCIPSKTTKGLWEYTMAMKRLKLAIPSHSARPCPVSERRNQPNRSAWSISAEYL